MKFSRKHIRRLAPAVGLGVMLSLAACSARSDNSASPPPAGAAASTQPEDLVAAAEKEGSLTWYTSFTDKDVLAIAGAFNKRYPNIKLNHLQGSIDKLTARIGTEQKGGKFNADLVQGSATYVVQLANGGELQPYEPSDAAPAPADLKLPRGYGNVDFVLTNVIGYNPQILKQEGLSAPTSYEDLTTPQWKGKFSADARDVGWYESLIDKMGHDKALGLVKALGANKPRIIESHTQAVTQVQSGEPVATIAAYGYKAAVVKGQTPETFDFANSDPLPASPDVIELVKNAPHPNAAKVFMNWFLSQGGQQTIVDVTGRASLRSEVQNVDGVWDPSTWAPAWSEPTLPASTFNQYTQELKSALGAQ